MAKGDGWGVMVSHRSGETEDTFIAVCVTENNVVNRLMSYDIGFGRWFGKRPDQDRGAVP